MVAVSSISEMDLTVSERLALAGRAGCGFTLAKLLWPTNLSFVSRIVEFAGAFGRDLAPAGRGGWWSSQGSCGISGMRMGRAPDLLRSAIFIVALLPLLGFFDIYFFRYSYVCRPFSVSGRHWADRAGSERRCRGFHEPAHEVAIWELCAAAIVRCLLGTALGGQARAYYNSEKPLWRDTLRRIPMPGLAENNLGSLLNKPASQRKPSTLRAGAADQARFRRSPLQLGSDLGATGQIPGSDFEHYEQALRLKTDFAKTHYNHWDCPGELGRVPESMEHWEQALRLNRLPEAHFNLGLDARPPETSNGGVRCITASP